MISHYQNYAASRPALTISLILALSCILAYVGTPTSHSLLTSAFGWLAIFVYTNLKLGGGGLLGDGFAQKLAWAAGTVLALLQIVDKAVEGRGTWWAKALWPLILAGINDAGVIDGETPNEHPLTRPLAIFSFAAVGATYTSVGSNGGLALGLSYAVLGPVSLLLIRRAKSHAKYGGKTVIYSASSLLSQPEELRNNSSHESSMVLIRDVSVAAAFFTSLATITLEGFNFGGLHYGDKMSRIVGDDSVFGRMILSIIFAVAIVLIHSAMDGAFLFMVQDQGAFATSLIPIAAAICAQFIVDFSFSSLWLATLCAASAWVYFGDQSASAANFQTKMRFGRLLAVVAVLSFALLALIHLRQPLRTPRFGTPKFPPTPFPADTTPKKALDPVPWDRTNTHPVDRLIRNAEDTWVSVTQSQSKTLEAAVEEYKKRYRIPPPPNFNKWFEFAKRKGVQLTDEYDTIYQSLLPFWAVNPATLRARTKEAIGFNDNMLMSIMIRNGKAVKVWGAQEWQQKATVGMLQEFVQYLPDMDLAFNIHDEPRVVVPQDELSRLVQTALNEKLPAAFANPSPKNSFSSRPRDVGEGQRVEEVKITRFNVFAHQPTWIPSRMSCPINSQARSLEDQPADNLTSYALSDLGFVYNHTAFSDICNSPSFATSHGFFDRPNAFNVVHQLVPVFSQSKMSSFQDILYPSPWYWYGKVSYDQEKDMDWKDKQSQLYWRGSTTGGFSRNGGWKRQHRQQVVKKFNGLDTAKVYKNINTGGAPEWKVSEAPRQDFQEIMNVHFSNVDQCDPGDCDAQKEFFKVVEAADQQDAWKYRYLLDIDGNAFSGRFYAFLESHSLTFKMSVFREWHEEWIKPWVHYIPLSLKADEGLELVRYVSSEAEGKEQATRIAEASRDWAKKALRKEDFEAWFFRLLLEYGRIVDDNRETIGYSGS